MRESSMFVSDSLPRSYRIAAPVVSLVVGLVALSASSAVAQQATPERTAAAAAYDEGARAFRRRQYAEAADAFERANASVPSAVALSSALRAHRSARNVQRAGTVALRLEGESGLSAQTATLVRQAIATARPRYVRVEVACSAECTLTVNGAPEPYLRFFAEPNRDLEIIAAFQTGAQTRHVTGRAGTVESLAFEAPAGNPVVDPEAVAAESEELTLDEGENPYRISRLRFLSRPRATFFVALTSTATVASVAVWSAVDARASSDDAGRAEANGETAARIAVLRAEHARDVHRTRGWVGFTGVMVAMTGLVAGFTDWTPNGEPATEAGVDVTAQGASAHVLHRF